MSASLPHGPRPRVFIEVTIGKKPVGRMVFELFADTCPKTVENFRALCTGERGNSTISGKPLAYKGSAFHRVIKGFMAQGGDFTRGDGTGGESIYGPSFKDENFILRHNAAGLLSMANAGRNTNGSQFFITFDAAPHLDNKHVVFGRLVQGMAVLRQVEDTTVGAEDRPTKKIVISDCGMVAAPNSVAAAETKAAAEQEVQQKKGPAPDVKAAEEPIPKDQPMPDFSGMSERERRIAEVKWRMNQASNLNRKAVVEEHKRFTDPEAARKKEKQREQNAKPKTEADDSKPTGLANIPSYIMNETAESVQAREEHKKKKQGNAAFGWDVFNTDALYRAYKKRAEKAPQLPNANDEEQLRDANSLDFADAQVDQAGVDRMIDELNETQARRDKFSRRRPHYEGADVDYISERNKVFNKKIKRAYDQYTSEIRNNLERGTAI